jgi:hypothetical protein
VHSEAALTAELEAPRRTIWIANESMHRRAQRPNNSADAADAALKEERALAELWKKRLEVLLAETKALLRTLEGERARMADLIAREKQSLGVNSESYSGAVLQYARPQGNAPKEVTDLERTCKESRRMRANNDAEMSKCESELEHMRSAVVAAFRAAIAQSKSTQVCCVCACVSVSVGVGGWVQHTQHSLHLAVGLVAVSGGEPCRNTRGKAQGAPHAHHL